MGRALGDPVIYEGKVIDMRKAWTWLAAWLLLLPCAVGAGITPQTKAPPKQKEVKVEGIVTYLEPDQCYIEALDRSNGIWVLGSTEKVGLGDPAAARGTLGVIMGEPVVFDAHIHPHTGKKSKIAPLELSNLELSGASSLTPWVEDYTWYPDIGAGEWLPATGPYNVGLLVTTSGTVRSIYESPSNGLKWLYIDDGSGVVSDLGDRGVLVYTDAEVQVGDQVNVTGISSVEPSLDDPSRLVRAIRTRDVADVEVILPPPIQPAPPFSDEFDSPTLDPRWTVLLVNGTVSTTARPGWLALTIYHDAIAYGGQPVGCEVVQPALGDWDLEMKLQTDITQQEGWPSGALIGLKEAPSDLLWRQPSLPGFSILSHALFWYDYVYWPPPLGSGIVWTWRCRAQAACHVSNEMPSDTLYYRLSRRGGLTVVSWSIDGVDYDVPGWPVESRGDYFTLTSIGSGGHGSTWYAGSQTDRTYFVDYVRFTPITSEGGLR